MTITQTIASVGLAIVVTVVCSQPSRLRGDTDPRCSVTCDPRGRVLASRGPDRTLRLWDVARRRDVAAFRGLADDYGGFAFDPTGTLLAVCDGSVRLWDVRSGKEIGAFGDQSENSRTVAFSPDGATVAVGREGGSVWLWDVASRQKTLSIKGYGGLINHIAFSPDGKTLATAGSDKTVSWYDVANGKLKGIFQGHDQNVLCVTFSPDGKTLASSSWDFSVILSDLSSGEARVLNAPWLGDDSAAYVTRLRFSPDGRELAGSAGDRVAVWDVATGKNTANHGRGYRPYHLSLSGLDQAISSDGLLGVRSLAYSPGGKLLAFGVDGSSILMWEMNAVLGVKPWAVLLGVVAGLLYLVVAPGLCSILAPVARAMAPLPAPRLQLPRVKPTRPAATQDSSGMLYGMRDALFFAFIVVGLILVYSRRS